MNPRHLTLKPGDKLHLPSAEGAPEQVHVFSEDEITAVNAALAARRALLVRGEPGTGKTQLALAAALALHRVFVSRSVDSRTEPLDLLWHFDAVARLGDAQVHGALQTKGQGDEVSSIHERLSIEDYIHPRPLWWAFDWYGAKAQAGRARCATPVVQVGSDPKNGVVVLIDEIDKAESDVPNGLLEALGTGQFTPQGMTAPVTSKGVPPLVMVTTNEERTLPDAFIRRCLVLHLALPTRRGELIAFLVTRGLAHFPDINVDVLEHAATLLCDDREKAQHEHWFPLPGLAEYIDLIRAVRELAPHDSGSQRDELGRSGKFVLRKSSERYLEG